MWISLAVPVAVPLVVMLAAMLLQRLEAWLLTRPESAERPTGSAVSPLALMRPPPGPVAPRREVVHSTAERATA